MKRKRCSTQAQRAADVVDANNCLIKYEYAGDELAKVSGPAGHWLNRLPRVSDLWCWRRSRELSRVLSVANNRRALEEMLRRGSMSFPFHAWSPQMRTTKRPFAHRPSPPQGCTLVCVVPNSDMYRFYKPSDASAGGRVQRAVILAESGYVQLFVSPEQCGEADVFVEYLLPLCLEEPQLVASAIKFVRGLGACKEPLPIAREAPAGGILLVDGRTGHASVDATAFLSKGGEVERLVPENVRDVSWWSPGA